MDECTDVPKLTSREQLKFKLLAKFPPGRHDIPLNDFTPLPHIGYGRLQHIYEKGSHQLTTSSHTLYRTKKTPALKKGKVFVAQDRDVVWQDYELQTKPKNATEDNGDILKLKMAQKEQSEKPKGRVVQKDGMLMYFSPCLDSSAVKDRNSNESSGLLEGGGYPVFSPRDVSFGEDLGERNRPNIRTKLDYKDKEGFVMCWLHEDGSAEKNKHMSEPGVKQRVKSMLKKIGLRK